jgi:UDP-N-acetyl-D-glucosamine dehydrogenase
MIDVHEEELLSDLVPSPAEEDIESPAAELMRRIEQRTARVVVVGQGYVGLPVAMRASQLGFPTVGYDVDTRRVADLMAGRSYVGDVSDAEVTAALARRYRATDQIGDLAGFDVAVITVPTPLREGAPDLRYIETAGRSLARVLKAGALVVLESTTYPGTTEEFLRPLLEESGLRAGRDFLLGYSPERIDPGNPTWTFVNTPKVVSGMDETSTRAVAAFYGTLVERVVEVGSTAEAELVKILENTYRHVNIALVNELAMFARDLGVDVHKAIDAAASKPFGFTPFRPGPGVGGHCLPIDPSYLSWRVRQNLGRTFRFVELANDVNEHMPDYVVDRVMRLLNEHGRALRGTRVLLLGIAYKGGTSDWRESPSLMVAQKLAHLGADIVTCDPWVPGDLDLGLPGARVDYGPEALDKADLVVVLVDHPEFDPVEIASRSKVVFDAKAILRGHEFCGEIL